VTLTPPTITHGRGFVDDCNQVTGLPLGDWTETEDGNVAAMTVDNNDYFKITVSTSVGNKIVYYSYPDEGGADNLGLDSDTYTKIRFRYKTSGPNIKAKIVLVFSAGDPQTVLDETDNMSWTTGVVDITSGKTIDHVRLYATQSTGEVYYDFVLIHEGEFTITGASSTLNLPPPRYPNIAPPGKDGVTWQDLGSDPATVVITAEMELGTWHLGASGPDGEAFYMIWHNHDWQWLTLPDHGVQFKVKPDSPSSIVAREGKLFCNLTFREYRLGNANQETYDERWGI